MKTRSMVGVASILFTLSACGGLRTRPQPDEETRLDVPYNADRREQWGPAAVADVLGFWGSEIDLKTLRREIHFTRGPEDVARDLESVGRVEGFKAELVQSDLRTIRKELDAGRPVIALVNLGFSWVPVRSYVVVTGYSDRRRCIYAHWGPRRDSYVSYRQFETDWRKAGSWIMRVSRTKADKPEPVAAPLPPPVAVTPVEPARARRRLEEPDPPIEHESPKVPDMIWFSP